MPDGSEIVGSSKDELWTAIKAWHEANSDSTEKAEIKFPVDIKFLDESIVTVNSKDDIRAAVDAWKLANPRGN